MGRGRRITRLRVIGGPDNNKIKSTTKMICSVLVIFLLLSQASNLALQIPLRFFEILYRIVTFEAATPNVLDGVTAAKIEVLYNVNALNVERVIMRGMIHGLNVFWVRPTLGQTTVVVTRLRKARTFELLDVGRVFKTICHRALVVATWVFLTLRRGAVF